MTGRVLVVFGLMALVATGCSQGAEYAAERMAEDALRASGAGDADVEISDDGMRFESEGEDGRTVMEIAGDGETDLPEGFPNDVPVPPGSTVLFSMSSEGEGITVALSVDGAPKAVFAFYAEQLAQEGWEIGDKLEMAGVYVVSATKDGRQVSISAAEGGDGTMVNIALSFG